MGAWGTAMGASVLVATALALSGVLKIRSHRSTVSAFRQLRLPEALVRYGGARALPWVEIVLALGLLLAPEPLDLPIALAAAVLVVVYVWLVARALGFAEPVTCGCFGTLGLGPITRWSLARNLLLLLLALVAVLDAARHAGPLVARVDVAGVGWLVLLLLAAVLGGLVVHRPDQAPVPGAHAGPPGDGPEEYVRGPFPFIELARREDDTLVSLHELVKDRPAMLVWASLTCGTCLEALEDLPRFAAANPELDVYGVLTPYDVEERGGSVPDGLEVLLDVRGAFGPAFAYGVPTAVLLGADQMLAGGPVTGRGNVAEFCEEIAESLAELRPAREGEAERQVS